MDKHPGFSMYVPHYVLHKVSLSVKTTHISLSDPLCEVTGGDRHAVKDLVRQEHPPLATPSS